ncbi:MULTISPECIES: MaoC family dehydratase [unclassified Crossiella]|uniref:MaoC family dehydratase n=1 Tax=unclassified Crossiella TaxID=2620835 RepID=UPI0020001733|nr:MULTISPECIES: MaoC family dehydratase [unclassified Crossiella]MCK2239824.1 MaoC family dehydratase [Crossiella sp. S99.2]MCK2252532.1 MaoC family dehydratase [Crossiella sp. S99.1]
MRIFSSATELREAVGQRLGVSAWHTVSAQRIADFAEVTEDRQWIHLHPERASAGMFGGPIAHGFLTVSLLPAQLMETIHVDGVDLVINKGMDRLRFHQPVPVGARVRAVFELLVATERPLGFTDLQLGVTGEIDGKPEAAFTARMRMLLHVPEPALAG